MASRSTIAADTWIDGNGNVHVNDIHLSGGTFAMRSGREAYSEIIESAVRTRVGELPLDTAQGIPYFETVFQSTNKIPDFESAIRARIEELYFVEGVTSLATDFDRENGVLRYTVTVETTDGESVTVESGIGRNAYLGDIVLPEGGNMQNLVQDGRFYLPVHIDNGVQKYRMLTDYEDPEDPDYGVQTAISNELYKKNPATGRFEEVAQ